MGDAVLRRVESTLHAAAIDPEGRAALGAGRLTKDLEAAGFGLEGMPKPKRIAKKRKTTRPAVDREAQKRKRELERARAEVEAAERRSTDASAAVRKAQEHLRDLERSSK